MMRIFLPALALIPVLLHAQGVGNGPAVALSPDARFSVGEILFQDDFRSGLDQWVSELEKPGKIAAANGTLNVDVPAGCTLWFKPLLSGPVMIEYQATVISAGGPNDRVSDLNCFWMAQDKRSPQDFFAIHRDGSFRDYDQLLCYYVGLGGNENTTTRFRRYIGEKNNRPLLPENDLRAAADLIRPNVTQTLRAVACGSLIQFYRDDQRLFQLNDPAPYTAGQFALRTVDSHIRFSGLRIYRLHPIDPAQAALAPNQPLLH
jgi:hypothetical protein